MKSVCQDVLGRFARPALLAAVFLGLAGSAVSAPTIIGAAYLDAIGKTCRDTAVCTAVFPALDPRFDVMRVDRMTCSIATSSTARLRSVRLAQAIGGVNNFTTANFLGPLEAMEPAGGVRSYNLNSETWTWVAKGHSPIVQAAFHAAVPTITMACHLNALVS